MDNEQLIGSLREKGVLKSKHIIAAFRAIDRADFVLPAYRESAYEDHPLPIGYGQTISQPFTVAFLLELLDPEPGEIIADIGSGSGWTTCLLAHCVHQEEGERRGYVAGIERIPELCAWGRKNTKKYGFEEKGTVAFFCRDATTDLPGEQMFDKILAGAAASKDIPESWRKRLKVKGRIVAPVENAVWLFIKKGESEWEEKEYPGFAFVPLVAETREQRQENRDKRTEIKDQRTENSKPQQESAPERYKGGLRTMGRRLMIFFLLVSGLLSLFSYEVYRPHQAFPDAKTVEIPQGSGSREIGALLKDEEVIRSKWAFVTYVFLTGDASRLKSGLYTFQNNTISDIAKIMVKGGEREAIITIPEGWLLSDIARRLEGASVLRADDFLRFAEDDGDADFIGRFPFLKDRPGGAGLEGYLFPDTYRMERGMESGRAASLMLDNFDKKFSEGLRTETARRGKTIFQIVTMASLIEKEVVSEEDRAVVSGILWKRLELGMPLQADATISYVKKQMGLPAHTNGRVTLEDTKIDSPYNTYLHPGLPAGPIDNPGLSALRAAVYPKNSPYLYYLSTLNGTTIFSRTLEEHNVAKAKYLRKE